MSVKYSQTKSNTSINLAWEDMYHYSLGWQYKPLNNRFHVEEGKQFKNAKEFIKFKRNKLSEQESK